MKRGVCVHVSHSTYIRMQHATSHLNHMRGRFQGGGGHGYITHQAGKNDTVYATHWQLTDLLSAPAAQTITTRGHNNTRDARHAHDE